MTRKAAREPRPGLGFDILVAGLLQVPTHMWNHEHDCDGFHKSRSIYVNRDPFDGSMSARCDR